MYTLLAIGLANAICAAVLAVPAYLAGRKGKPALAHALWLLVLIKLVTPPLFRLPLPCLPPDGPATQAVRASDSPAPLELTSEVLPSSVASDIDLLVEAAPALPAARFGAPASPIPPATAMVGQELVSPLSVVEPAAEAIDTTSSPGRAEPPDLLPLLLLVWLAGLLFCLGRATVLMLRFHRLLAHARPAPEALQRQADELARALGLHGSPPVWLVPGALPPMVWALGRTRILFPAGLLERLGDEERASLLVHELAHVRRRDHWVRWLEVVTLGVYWWYPLAWFARLQLQAREEECCDSWAAQQLSPRTYASAILEAVDFLAEARPRLPAVASPLAGARALRKRLTLIMTGSATGRLGWLARLTLFGLAVAVLPLLPSLTRLGHGAAPPVTGTKGDETKAAAADPEGEPTNFANNPINLLGGVDSVYSVAISPDGSRIAAGMGNFNRPGRVEVWDFATRKFLWAEPEKRGVSSVAFSPDSKRLGWSGWGGLTRIEQLFPRRPLFRVPLVDSNHRLAFSRDGKWLALAGEDRSVRLLDARTGRLIASPTDDPTSYYCVAFSHDSKLFAVGGGRFNANGQGGPNHVNVFDVGTRKVVGKLTGHTLAVTNVAFSPTDPLIATASADSTVRIWDGKTFRLRAELRGHSAGIKGLAFSPDGKTLATGSWDSTIRLWGPLSGKFVAQLEGQSPLIREIAFSPDGKYLVSGGDRHSIKLWDVTARKLLATLHEDAPPGESKPPQTMAVSPDGKVVAIALASDSGEIQLRDARSGSVRLTLTPDPKTNPDAVSALAFSADGKFLASGGPDMAVRIWDSAAGKLTHFFPGDEQGKTGHSSWVYALAFSRDGKRLASGSYDRTVRLWDPAAGKFLGTLKGHKATVRALSFSPDRALLASGSADHKVRLWDLRHMKSKAVLNGHEGSVRGVAFAPSGKLLVSASEDGQLRLWDPDRAVPVGKPQTGLGELVTLSYSPAGRVFVTGNEGGTIAVADGASAAMRQTWYAHNQGVKKVALAAGGRSLFSLGGDGMLKVWEGSPGPLRFLEGHTGPVRVATFSPDGKYLLSGGGWPEGDRTLRLWDVKTGKQVRQFMTGQVQLQSAVFSPDGKHAAAGEDSGVIHLFEVESGKEVRKFRGHKDGIPGLTFSRDGKWLLSGGVDRTVRLWDAQTGEEVRQFKGHTDWVRCVLFHPDGKRILSGGRDRVVRVWDLKSGKELQSFDHNKEWVERMALLPDGKRLLSCGGNDMRLWDLDSGKPIRAFTGHRFGTTWLALARDGRTALSASYDGTVRYWDIETGHELKRFGSHRNWVWSVDISPDGKTFATAGGGGRQGEKWIPGDDFAIRLWKTPHKAVTPAP